MRKTQKKESKLIPVLFTLGIIGWGFFAIDRLTMSQSTDSKESMQLKGKFNHIKKKVHHNETSFFEKTQNWILQKLVESKNIDRANKKASDQKKRLLLNKKYTRVEKSSQVRTPKKKTKEHEKRSTNIRLYFYKSNSPELKLHPVVREVFLSNSENIEKIVLRHLVAGPTGDELIHNFLDSFPNKPRVESVQKNGNLLSINFASSFGKGLSHQMVKFQLKQLFVTATQFKDISKIRLTLNHKPITKVGGDGLVIPDVIKKDSWLLASSY